MDRLAYIVKTIASKLRNLPWWCGWATAATAICIACVLLCIVTTGHSDPVVDEVDLATTETVTVSEMHGVDLSGYQETTYNVALRLRDVDFVVCRAAEGMDVDAYCDRIYQEAKRLGLPRGVYFLAYTARDAREYAQWCANTVEGYLGDSIVVLDMENTKNYPNNIDPVWSLEWLQAFEEFTGVKPLIYMNLAATRDYNWSEVVANGNPLWLAYYEGEYSEVRLPLPDEVPYWGKDGVVIHQYSQNWLGRFDADIFFGTPEDWDGLAQASQP